MDKQDPNLAAQLRPGYLIGFAVLWMILGGIGLHLNGGLGPIKTVGAAVVMSMAGILISVVAGGPLYSNRIRQWAFKEEVAISDVRLRLIGYTLIGILFTAKGVACVFKFLSLAAQ